MMGSMSHGWPKRCTGMIAFVLGVIAPAILSASMRAVSSRTSTSTGFAPVMAIASAVAMKVLGTVMTSSPGPMP